MLFLINGYVGGFFWKCVKEFGLGSYCIQRTIVDGVNLLFLCVFYLLLVIESRRNHCISGANGRDWFTIVVSICCILTSTACFSACVWDLIAKNDEFNHLSSLVYFVRGLVWITFTVSLLVQRSKWIKILNSIWWVFCFLLVSALNIEILMREHSIQILDIMLWSVNFLLLCCAFRNINHLIFQHTPEKTQSEPLLNKKDENGLHTKLGQASFLSKLTFSWINSLLSLGYSKLLALEDIPSLVSEDEANLAYQKFSDAWESLLREGSSSQTSNLVLQAIARVHLKENIFVAICAFLRTVSVVVSPLVLYAFVNHSTNSHEEDLYEGLSIVGCLVLAKVVESFSQRHCFFQSRRSGMRVRSALMVAVYQKQLMLSSLGRKRHSTGEIVNYVAVDAYRMGEFPWWFHSTWSLGLQLFLGIGVLFGVVGIGALPGLIPLLICGFVNVPFAKMLQKCQSQFMISQDERLRTTSEILNSMKIIKLQSWEEKFRNLIESLRNNEFKWLAEAHFKKTYSTLLYWMSPTIISSVIFFGCVIFRSAPLNASTIFTILATLRSMGEPVRMIPEGLSILIQVKVSLDRLNVFLLDDELKNDEIFRTPLQNSDKSVKIQYGNFSWDPEPILPTLREINLEIEWGQKIGVCGPVGAGKSSLLCSILGEIPKVSGTVSYK
jgi:ABC-type siderophore export system fused ATPase/permease subunit